MGRLGPDRRGRPQLRRLRGRALRRPRRHQRPSLVFNKDLLSQAGLPENWQPASWEDLLDAGRALKSLDGVVPIQLNAGTAMGEATTMQGLLPILAGTGTEVWTDGMWLGNTQGLRDALTLYRTIYVDEQ